MLDLGGGVAVAVDSGGRLLAVAGGGGGTLRLGGMPQLQEEPVPARSNLRATAQGGQLTVYAPGAEKVTIQLEDGSTRDLPVVKVDGVSVAGYRPLEGQVIKVLASPGGPVVDAVFVQGNRDYIMSALAGKLQLPPNWHQLTASEQQKWLDDLMYGSGATASLGQPVQPRPPRNGQYYQQDELYAMTQAELAWVLMDASQRLQYSEEEMKAGRGNAKTHQDLVALTDQMSRVWLVRFGPEMRPGETVWSGTRIDREGTEAMSKQEAWDTYSYYYQYAGTRATPGEMPDILRWMQTAYYRYLKHSGVDLPKGPVETPGLLTTLALGALDLFLKTNPLTAPTYWLYKGYKAISEAYSVGSKVYNDALQVGYGRPGAAGLTGLTLAGTFLLPSTDFYAAFTGVSPEGTILTGREQTLTPFQQGMRGFRGFARTMELALLAAPAVHALRPVSVGPAAGGGAATTAAEVEGAVRGAEAAWSTVRSAGPKTMAANELGQRTLSGWASLPGFTQATTRVMRLMEVLGIALRRHGFDGGILGRFFASHAERQLIAISHLRVIAVSRTMCADCVRFFTRLAMVNRRMYTVADPTGIRLFMPDGNVVFIRMLW